MFEGIDTFLYDLMRKSKIETMAAPFVSPCVCASCGAPGDSIPGGVKLKPCSVCKTAKYCGRECQIEHWKKHKPDCRAPQGGSTHPTTGAYAPVLGPQNSAVA